MDPLVVGNFWNSNAPGWIAMVRSGCDVYRDKLNAPAFLAMLPGIDGMSGLDIGCGEGYSARHIADLGASVTGIDLSEKLIEAAADTEKLKPRRIRYTKANALSLPFDDATFDFATAFMSLMDMPDPDRALGEAYRVIKPGGFLQFAISHPCFALPYRKNKRDGNQLTYAFELGGYFNQHNGYVEEWTFNNAPAEMREKYEKFKVPRFSLTMSEWINLLIDSHFKIERISEPRPSRQPIDACPRLQDASVVQARMQELGVEKVVARMLHIGDVTDAARDVQEAAIEAQQAAIAAIKPGVLAQEVAAAANQVYQRRGYQTGYRTGRIGDLIVVTDSGSEYITACPREILLSKH